MAANITVLGSLNMDLIYRVPKIPVPGETLASSSFQTTFGGKGANQALAAHHAGASVSMLGCVGRDEWGEQYLLKLSKAGIYVASVLRSDTATGSAAIFVDPSGENIIVVDRGANAEIGPDQIEGHELLKTADVLLAQLETPVETVAAACQGAKKGGATIIVNPSPWDDEFLASGIQCDYLIVNETEAAAFLKGDFSAVVAGKWEEIGARHIVITRGAKSTLGVHCHDGRICEVPVPQVKPVDTVGAGDCFAGAFAKAIGDGTEMIEAIRLANGAAAQATLVEGAQCIPI